MSGDWGRHDPETGCAWMLIAGLAIVALGLVTALVFVSGSLPGHLP